jgi:hypothetical protein
LNNPETMRAIGKFPGMTVTAARVAAKKLQANGVELRQLRLVAVVVDARHHDLVGLRGSSRAPRPVA